MSRIYMTNPHLIRHWFQETLGHRRISNIVQNGQLNLAKLIATADLSLQKKIIRLTGQKER